MGVKMNSDIRLALKKAKRSGHIVSVHSDPSNQASCAVGYVDQIDDTWIRLKAISIDGENAGYEIRSLDDIFRIDINGAYEKKIGYLRKNTGKIFREVDLSAPIETDGILLSTLKEAQKKKMVITIWTEDEDDSIVGSIDHINENTVKILSIDDYGKEDGFILISIDEIVSVDCNSRKCQIIKFLNEKK